MLVGLQTDYCVDASVKSAFERGYKVVVPVDSNSTFGNRYMDGETVCRYFNELIWPGRYAECISSDKAAEILAGN